MSVPHYLDTAPAPGKRASLALAIAVHVALALFLVVGVSWHSTPPASVQVELWNAAPGPVTAAPRPSKPPPPPPAAPQPKAPPKPAAPPPTPVKSVAKPDIVVKKEPEKKPEPKHDPKPEAKPDKKVEPKPEKAPEPKPDIKADKKPAPLVPDFSSALSDDLKQVNKKVSRQQSDSQLKNLAEAEIATTARNIGRGDYAAKISQKVRGNVVLPPNIQGNPEAIYRVEQLPTGEIIGEPKLEKSSGNQALDAAVARAIVKSSPLPLPDSGKPDRVITIKYRPRET